MDNDSCGETEDLNTLISYVQLSDESFNYPAYTYLVPDPTWNIRTSDNLYLLTETLWGENGEFVLDINTTSPVTFYDYYKFTEDIP